MAKRGFIHLMGDLKSRMTETGLVGLMGDFKFLLGQMSISRVAKINGNGSLENLKGKTILNKCVAITNCQDSLDYCASKFSGEKPIFKSETVFIKDCNNQLGWFNNKVFPNAKRIYFLAHPFTCAYKMFYNFPSANIYHNSGNDYLYYHYDYKNSQAKYPKNLTVVSPYTIDLKLALTVEEDLILEDLKIDEMLPR